jgi:hypothetical protein
MHDIVRAERRQVFGSLNGTLGGIKLKNYDGPYRLIQGYWDYAGDFTSYILNNVCQSSSCN